MFNIISSPWPEPRENCKYIWHKNTCKHTKIFLDSYYQVLFIYLQLASHTTIKPHRN